MKSFFRTLGFVTLMSFLPTLAYAQEEDEFSGDPFEDDTEGLIEPDEIFGEPEQGFRFQASALLWMRHGGSAGGSVIGGPESFGIDTKGVPVSGGYRFNLSWLIDPNYELEGSWSEFAGWNGGTSGVLAHAISFDGGQGNTIVDPAGNGNFINGSTFFRPLAAAARDSLNGTNNDETTEFEFLRPGATYATHYSSELTDGQVVFKERRTPEQRLRWGLGYRNLRLAEQASVLVTGQFNAFDIDGDEQINNSPNDQLSDEALVAHGLTRTSGGGGFRRSAAGIDDFTLYYAGNATNRLNGVVGTADFSLLKGERLTVDGLARMGIFHNRIDGSVVDIYSQLGGSEYRRELKDQKDAAAFVGNLGINSYYQVTDHFRLRGGYELMYISNVALGTSQERGLVYDAFGRARYSVQTGDSLILHGLNAGLEFVW